MPSVPIGSNRAGGREGDMGWERETDSNKGKIYMRVNNIATIYSRDWIKFREYWLAFSLEPLFCSLLVRNL
jgi:hypothetical protein